MGGFGYYLISAVFLVVFLGVSWVVTGLLHLSGTTEMIVRTLLMGLVFAGFGALYWLRSRRQNQPATEAERAQVFLVVFLGVSWVVTGLLHLSGTTKMIVRTLLMGLVFAGFGALYWLRIPQTRVP